MGSKPTSNNFLSIDMTWSYNFIGGIKEQRDLNMDVVNAVYMLACDYIMERHNFIRSGEATRLNGCQEIIWKRSDELHVSSDYVLFYCEAAFRAIKSGLDSLQSYLVSVSAVTDEKGDVLGFVVTSYKH